MKGQRHPGGAGVSLALAFPIKPAAQEWPLPGHCMPEILA